MSENANAEYKRFNDGLIEPDFSSAYEEIFDPVLKSNAVVVDKDDVPPKAPVIPKIIFRKPPLAKDPYSQVKSLTEGVTTVIPPQYDHYGYEIRRYMQNVGDTKIYEDEEFLKEQILNVRKAMVIAEFWERNLSEELESLKGKVEEVSALDMSIRSFFKRQETDIQRFKIVLHGWLSFNEKMLLHVHKDPDYYSVIYPEIIVSNTVEKIAFYNLYAAKQARLRDLKKFRPFEIMVY